MWPYWLLFLIPAMAAVLKPHRQLGAQRRGLLEWDVSWFAMTCLVASMIGLRHEVGGDWGNYFAYLDEVRGASFAEVVAKGDPGYNLINWLSSELGLGIYGVNLFCGVVLAAGLATLGRSLPRPWLSMTVAIPYLVIVVGMGYSRQGVALGFAMIGLAALQRQATFWFVFWIILGATFHKSAVLLLPIAALSSAKNKYWTALWVGVVAIVAYQLLLEDAVENLYVNYIEAQYQSQGALVRVLMNAIPAALLLLWSRRFLLDPQAMRLWRWMAVLSLGLLFMLVVSPSSTAVDRIALYMLPLQMVVFAYLPEVVGSRQRSNQKWVAAIVLYYALVQFVWLNFAVHASGWLPYRFYPLETL